MKEPENIVTKNFHHNFFAICAARPEKLLLSVWIRF
jgi:hypothetical protein